MRGGASFLSEYNAARADKIGVLRVFAIKERKKRAEL